MNNKRRVGPDFWMKFIKSVGTTSWFILFCIITIYIKAQPEVENFITGITHAKVRKTWNLELVNISYYLMLMLFFIAITALIANISRHKRSTDKYSLSVILMVVFSMIGLIMFGVKF